MRISGCVVHDPAVDWMADDARIALLGSSVARSITPSASTSDAVYSKRQLAAAAVRFGAMPIMCMYSEMWLNWGTGAVHTIRTRLRDGQYGEGSHFCALAGSAHFSFTDMWALPSQPLPFSEFILPKPFLASSIHAAC